MGDTTTPGGGSAELQKWIKFASSLNVYLGAVEAGIDLATYVIGRLKQLGGPNNTEAQAAIDTLGARIDAVANKFRNWLETHPRT